MTVLTGIDACGPGKGAGETLEDGFNDVVRFATVFKLDVQIAPTLVGEGLEEFLHEADVEIADHVVADLYIVDQAGTVAEIYHHTGESLVHGQQEKTIALDTKLVTHRLLYSLPEYNADILDGVVVVDVDIPLSLDVKIKQAMSGTGTRSIAANIYHICALGWDGKATLACLFHIMKFLAQRLSG